MLFTVVAPVPVLIVAIPAWLASVPALIVEAPVRLTVSNVVTLVNWASVMTPESVNTRVSLSAPPSIVSVLVRPATVTLKVSAPTLPWRLTSPLVLAVIVSAAALPRTVSKPEIPPVPVAVPVARFTVTALP